MPRQARVSVGGIIYHIVNRANGRVQIFNNTTDYKHFEDLMQEAKDLTGMRILAYCIMPNHFHLVLYPVSDTDLGAFMGWLTSTHVRQYRTRTKTIGYGHLYQDRYKSFPVQSNSYATAVIRYVEQNPLRAQLVERAEDWQWSSLWRREKGIPAHRKLLDDLPIELPQDYLRFVNEVPDAESLETLRHCVNKGTPFGAVEWVEDAIERYGLTHTLRGSGRPRQV